MARVPLRRNADSRRGKTYHHVLQSDMAPGQFCTYAHATWKNGTSATLHDHDHHEILWVNEGEGFHLINGKQTRLTAGMLVLVLAEDAHQMGAEPGGMLHITNFAFLCSSWRSIRDRYFHATPSFFALKSVDDRMYILNPTKILDIRQAARDLERGARDLFATERFLLDVLGILQAHWLLSEQSQTPRWLLQACEDVREAKNFEGGTMMFAKKIAGRSPAHVARACKKYLGTTPTEIVNEARMSYAAARLVMTDDTILDIAMDCGFANLGHFYRLFRQAHGFSPSAYRRYQTAALSEQKGTPAGDLGE